MPRLLLVSNRLPVTVKSEHRQVTVTPSAGGLATGLRGPHELSEGLWIGWPGDVSHLSPDERAKLDKRLSDLRTVPVHLTPGEVTRYYDGFSNGVLWPLFHYLLDRGAILSRDFDAYRKVNERFADHVAQQYREGDLVWVHDYQLMLLPAMLRRRLPNARIGFFLHIPFPASEVFRSLPWRSQILEGLLGADLVGFHTLAYMRHFATALLDVLGLEVDIDGVWYEGREVRLGAFPMSIDAAAFAAVADSPEVVADVAALRREREREQLLVGIDRLDYTKGIAARLHALERLLEREPALRGHIRLLQVAVPSRTKIEAYEGFRRRVEELVGRINGSYATVRSAPIHYMFRSISQRQVVTLFRAADVMLVTPLRDGLNLVAKEFVASRTDDDGVLVLSEFAGAASELGEALLVNPYDADAIAAAIKKALAMPKTERQQRMRALRRRVMTYDVHHWARTFIERLEETRDRATLDVQGPTAPDRLAALSAELRSAERLVVLVEYDGTLVPFAATPDSASPDAELLSLLSALGSRSDTFVQVISGRSRHVLEAWLGELPIGLYAEYGIWSRPSAGEPWTRMIDVATDWIDKVRPYVEQITARTPGSLIEEKATAIAWHYRSADPSFGALQAKELRLHLAHMLRNAPVEFVQGNKVVEARSHPVPKSTIIAPLLKRLGASCSVLAVGHDKGSEELFASLPGPSACVHVGPGPTRAPLRLRGPLEARAFLASLLET